VSGTRHTARPAPTRSTAPPLAQCSHRGAKPRPEVEPASRVAYYPSVNVRKDDATVLAALMYLPGLRNASRSKPRMVRVTCLAHGVQLHQLAHVLWLVRGARDGVHRDICGPTRRRPGARSRRWHVRGYPAAGLRKNSESQTGRADRRWLASPSCCCYVTCHVSRMALSSTARDRASSIAL
jgi:hypothetical protein